MILALDTVFEQCSVALVTENAEVIDEQTEFGNRQQTQQILPMIQAIFAKNNVTWQDITAIAFNRGPGAFSGIRINTAVAQALSFAHDLPCLPVSSLQAVAQKALYLNRMWDSDNHSYSAIDARMNQVYLGEFYAQEVIQPALQAHIPLLMVAKGDEQLVAYGYETLENYPVIGDGGEFLARKDRQKAFMYDNFSRPTAGFIGQIGAVMLANGEQVSAENALPVYLRHNAWKTIAEQEMARQNK